MSVDSKEPSAEEVKVEDESNASEESEVKMLLKQDLKERKFQLKSINDLFPLKPP